MRLPALPRNHQGPKFKLWDVTYNSVALELKIDKLVYGGEGLARLPANEQGRGKAVFLPLVLEGERVDCTLIEQKPGYARGGVQRIVEPSRHRMQPVCPYFGRCGGCHYQHSNYEHQLEIKAAILKESLRRIAKLDLARNLEVHPSAPWNYRNRTRLRVQTTPQFALGYNRLGSCQLEPVEQCPISSALINRAISASWTLGRGALSEAAVREIEFFADAADSRLLLEIYVHGRGNNQAIAVAERIRSALPEVSGVSLFPAPQPSAVSTEHRAALATSGARALEYSLGALKYRVSAGSFFQSNRHLTAELVEIVTAGRSGGTAMDLYAGVGLFSTPLAARFEQVIAVESSPECFADLQHNLPKNGKPTMRTVESYLTTAPRDGGADLIVVDPPRGGLGQRIAARLSTFRAPRLVYVSCDPATLARDLIPLLAAGYQVERAHLVDLFPQTFHIESVLHLVKQ
ncbi:MAG: 23S rRNA (uracil(1939)-C(5))-methyltransferase RlmD [Acidobacteria bacterium]|nr:23S rRNA (uracil(1939)-C(5))-methyltransferase RlmD [Acidobacteriota bacterium]